MLPNTQCVIYLWKDHAKSSSMVMIKNIACGIHYMLHVTNLNNFTNDPVCYIFMESSLNMQFNGHGLNIMYYMSHMLHITNIKLETILPNTQ